MIHHVELFKLRPEVTPAKLEEMMMNTRMSLLKIPEVLAVKCGKKVDPKNEWPFFIALEFESMDKFAAFKGDAIHLKFMEEVVKPNTTENMILMYEMEPGKDVRYS
ncbi:MAG: Dabb family protein [Chthoniobacteraceae bacterium]|jgi:hypothetical protein